MPQCSAWRNLSVHTRVNAAVCPTGDAEVSNGHAWSGAAKHGTLLRESV